MLVVVSLLAGAVPAGARAEPGSYHGDVGAVYGAMRGLKQMADICADVFPETGSANRTALLAWRDRYAPFVTEIEQRFLHLHAAAAAGDEARYRASVEAFEANFAARTEQTKETLRTQAPDALRRDCNAYPELIASDNVDFERRYADEVARIRAQLPALPTRPGEP